MRSGDGSISREWVPSLIQDLFSAPDRVCEIHVRAAADMGFPIRKYPRLELAYCGAVVVNSWVIDPYGDLHKCWQTVGLREEAISSLSDDAKHFSWPNFRKWLLWNPVAGVCENCSILPICMGGCPYPHVMPESPERPECEEWKANLRDFLQLLYERNGLPSACPNARSITL